MSFGFSLDTVRRGVGYQSIFGYAVQKARQAADGFWKCLHGGHRTDCSSKPISTPCSSTYSIQVMYIRTFSIQVMYMVLVILTK